MTPSGAFISYSSTDRRFARRLADDLKAQDIPIWFAEFDLEPGDSLFAKIESAIEQTEFLIVVLTPASVKSSWVKEEVRLAMHDGMRGKKFPIIPVLREPCEIPGFLREKVYSDMRPEADYRDALKKLVRKIKGGLKWKDDLKKFKNEIDLASEPEVGGRPIEPSRKAARTNGTGKKISPIDSVIKLIEKAIAGQLTEQEWRSALESISQQSVPTGGDFNQAVDTVHYQINIGSITLPIPVPPSESIDSKTLNKAENRFRALVSERFKESAENYIPLSGETTEAVPAANESVAPRSARRCRERISSGRSGSGCR